MGCNARYWSFLLIMGIGLLAAGCDSPSAPEVPEEKQRPLLAIPDHGSTPLPLQPHPDSLEQAAPPAYELLSRYARQHPENPYVAVVGVWNPDKAYYEYRALPLEFPAELTRKAPGQPAYYHYQLADTTGRRLRTLAGLIPPTEKARAGMRRWLQVKDRSLVVSTYNRRYEPPLRGGKMVGSGNP